MGKIIQLVTIQKEGKEMGKSTLKRGELDAENVALYFLSKESMSNKKLQKLCYYAQAWYYAFYDEGLFYQDIEAWVHGPVVKDIYNRYKDNKWKLIDKVSIHSVNGINDEIAEFLDDVYDKYGEFDGDDLEALTHSELPWQEARKGLEEWQPSNNIINPVTMSDYYWRKYESIN
ncbi:Panacea domain-containing protein [Clostridium chromiireducens]|uniref:Panacea domain-containing protein n=1 Tax=Clostridium chromiireducens TaxID=225345 RepID=UPI003AF87486